MNALELNLSEANSKLRRKVKRLEAENRRWVKAFKSYHEGMMPKDKENK